MKKIQLNNIIYDCPTSWDDVTLEDQIRVARIATEYSGLTAQLQLIAGYANIDVEVIKKTNINKLPTLIKHLDFIQKPLSEEPIDSFDFKGDKYFVMPTLINAEFQDFISLEATIKNNEEHSYDGLPMMIAILAKKANETLDDYDVEERAEMFMKLPIEVANRVSVFFSQIGMLSQLNIQISSEEIVKQAEEELIQRFEELENIMKQSDGGGWRGRLQKKILRKYVQSLKKNFNLS